MNLEEETTVSNTTFPSKLPLLNLNEEEVFLKNILYIDISKPKTIFSLFQEEEKAKKKDYHKKDLSQAYKDLSSNELERLKSKRRKDKIRYERHVSLVKKYILNPDKLKDTRTPYTLYKESFIVEYLQENECEYKEAEEAAKARWSHLDQEEIQFWKDKFHEEKEELKMLSTYSPMKVTSFELFSLDLEEKGLSNKEILKKWEISDEKTRILYENKAKVENERKERLGDLYEIAMGNKPKKPMSPQALFFHESSVNDNVKVNNFTELNKIFYDLPLERREEYKQKQKILKLKFLIKKEEYNKLNPYKAKSMSGYNLYTHDLKSKISCSPGELFKKAKEMWWNETKKVRDEYKKRAKIQKIDNKFELIDRKLKPMQPYNRFVRDYSMKRLSNNKSNLFIEVSSEWKKISSKEKMKMNEEYQKEYKDYKDSMKKDEKYRNNNKNRSRVVEHKLKSEYKKIRQSRTKSSSKKMRFEVDTKEVGVQTDVINYEDI